MVDLWTFLTIFYSVAFRDGGGVVCGQVDSSGNLTGSDLVYLYPDLTTCLSGTFTDGQFISGHQASIVSLKKRLVRSFIISIPIDL